MVYIDENNLKITKQIIKSLLPEAEIFAYGSRVHGKNLKKYSDLDIIINNKKPIDFNSFIKLKSEFSESDIPFRIDFSDYYSLTDEFKASIKPDLTKI